MYFEGHVGIAVIIRNFNAIQFNINIVMKFIFLGGEGIRWQLDHNPTGRHYID